MTELNANVLADNQIVTWPAFTHYLEGERAALRAVLDWLRTPLEKPLAGSWNVRTMPPLYWEGVPAPMDRH